MCVLTLRQNIPNRNNNEQDLRYVCTWNDYTYTHYRNSHTTGPLTARTTAGDSRRYIRGCIYKLHEKKLENWRLLKRQFPRDREPIPERLAACKHAHVYDISIGLSNLYTLVPGIYAYPYHVPGTQFDASRQGRVEVFSR